MVQLLAMRLLYVTKYVAGCLPGRFTYHGEWTDTFELAMAVGQILPGARIALLTPPVLPEHADRFDREFGSALRTLGLEHIQAGVRFDRQALAAWFRLRLLPHELLALWRTRAQIVQYGQFGLSWAYPLRPLLGVRWVAYGCLMPPASWPGKERDRPPARRGIPRRAAAYGLEAARRLLRMKLFDPRLDRLVFMHRQGYEAVVGGDARARLIPKGCTSKGVFRERRALRKVFYLGLLQRRKGLPDFLKVAERLPDLDFHVVGPPGAEGILQDLQQARERLPNVHYEGDVGYDEKWALLDGFDLLLYPSYLDANPSVILEAMSCGIPVVTSDAFDHRVVDGDNGVVASSGDIDALEAALRDLLAHPEALAALSRGARRTYERNTWAIAAEAFVALYREILS